MNKKTLTILGIVLLVVIAGSFWYVKNQEKTIKPIDVIKEAQKENDEKKENEVALESDKEIEELDFDEVDTSDWKTYRNEEYGFEVRYPKDWIFGDPAYPSNISYDYKPEIDYVVGFAKGSFEGDWTIVFAIGKNEDSFNKVRLWDMDLIENITQQFNDMQIEITKWENTCNTIALHDNVNENYMMNISGYCDKYGQNKKFNARGVITGMIKTLKFD